MPRPRFERADPKLQRALLEAAAGEFSSEGYEGASVNRILAAAGLSKGAFYYYFDDKADLAGAVLARDIQVMLEHLGEVPRPSSVEEFWAVVWGFVAETFKQLRESPSRGDLLGRLGTAVARDPELQLRLGPMFQQMREKITVIWQAGQEVGAVRTDLPIPALLRIIEGMKMAAASVLLPTDRAPSIEELESFTRLHLDLVRRLVEPRGGQP